jgi:hypothetical protein
VAQQSHKPRQRGTAIAQAKAALVSSFEYINLYVYHELQPFYLQLHQEHTAQTWISSA